MLTLNPLPLLPSLPNAQTTLLDLLAGRKTVGQLAPDSRILYGGRRPSASFLRRHLAYVEQFDTLLPSLTGGAQDGGRMDRQRGALAHGWQDGSAAPGRSARQGGRPVTFALVRLG